MKKMTLKSKLTILGICALFLVAIFTFNVAKRYMEKKSQEIILREEQMITTKEVKYLLNSLNIKEEDYKHKLSEEQYRPSTDEEFLTFEKLIFIIPVISGKYDIDINLLMDSLSFQVLEEKPNKAVLVVEFLEVYDKTVDNIALEKSPVEEEKLFIVGIPDRYKKETDKQIMSTNQGNYNFANGLDYAKFYADGKLIDEAKNNKDEENIRDKEKGTDLGNNFNKFDLDNFIDHKVSAIVSDGKLIYIKEILDEETILHNAWLIEGSGKNVKSFIHEVTRELHTQYNLSQDINELVGDLIIKNQEIIGIRIKPDRIDGKVLVTNTEYIEVDGYGQIPLDEDYKIYKVYGELAQEPTNSILVGYETTDFIVAEGKIVAALIKGPIKAENIRVLIKTNQFQDYNHKEISFTCKDDFTLSTLKNTKTYPGGSIITYKVGDNELAGGRITVKSTSETGKIEVLSVERSYGTPAYRGSIEIAPSDKGLIIINELPLEEYLYAVLPSEMPSYYGLEALKSQAVCARSYAYNHLMANSLKEYGAHVDDSVSYQVYNNIAENEETILAVKDTFGRVMTYDDQVINAYYFSTSSGHTASVGEVWSGDAQYLTGKLQAVNQEGQVPASALDGKLDFSNEQVFRDFILNPAFPTYDSEFNWYRWKVDLPYSELSENINSKIANRYMADPNKIKTLVSNEAGENIFESHHIESIGDLQDVQIMNRGKSGIVNEIKLIGKNKTVKISSEYNIRTLLAPVNQKIIRQDDSQVSLNMLPSAFFIINKTNHGIEIAGGGYGHGVGMSQNGAKALSDQGLKYDEILGHYYSGVTLDYIYD